MLQELDVRPDGPDVRLEARMSSPTIPDRDLDLNTRFGAEIDDFGGKIDGISWMESGETWEILDPVETKQIHGSKSKKHHQTNKSQKIWGLFLVGIFEC